MQWNNVAFSFLWLFTGLCLSAVSFCAEKRRIRLGWGTGDLARGVCPHSVLWFLVFETRKLILEDEFLIARSWP